MSYSQDLKMRVIQYVKNGGRRSKATILLSVSRAAIYRWLHAPPDHQPRKPGPKTSRKFDQEELRRRLEANPDSLQKEHAAYFNVSINAISHALKCLGIVRKKRLYMTSRTNTKNAEGGAI